MGCVAACGNHNFSGEKNKLTQADLDAAKSALQVSVKNAIPEIQVDCNRIRPHLNAYFCSALPIPKGDSPTPRTEERCVSLAGVIENETTETVLVSKEDVARIYNQGQGKGAFEFNDNHGTTAVPWHCTPNHQVNLDSNHDHKQIWHVEVNHRHTLSYGCLIKRR